MLKSDSKRINYICNSINLNVIINNTKNCHDSCEYGIAINKQSNTMIYYASNPD